MYRLKCDFQLPTAHFLEFRVTAGMGGEGEIAIDIDAFAECRNQGAKYVDNESFQTNEETCVFQPCGFVWRNRSKFRHAERQLKFGLSSKPSSIRAISSCHKST